MTTITARRINLPDTLASEQRERFQALDDRLAERHAKFFISDLARLAGDLAAERAFNAQADGVDKEISGRRLAELEGHAAAKRGDAAVAATKGARDLIAAADAAGLIVMISHSSAINGAPYFDVQTLNPVTGDGFEATFHTFKGKNGSYGFMHGSLLKQGRRHYNATLKAMREHITPSTIEA